VPKLKMLKPRTYRKLAWWEKRAVQAKWKGPYQGYIYEMTETGRAIRRHKKDPQ